MTSNGILDPVVASGPSAAFSLPNLRHRIGELHETPAADGGATGTSGSTQTQTGGSGGAAPIALSEDSMITPPGATEPVRYGDYIKGFVPRKDHESYAQNFQKNLLASIVGASTSAKNLRGQPQQQQTQGQPHAQQQFAQELQALQDMGIVDGRTLLNLYQKGISPIQYAVSQLINAVKQQGDVIKKLQGGVGNLSSRNFEADNSSKMSNAIKSLGLDYKADDPFLQELTTDIFHSFEHDEEFEKEFPKILKQRVEAAIKFVRALDQAKLKSAQERKPFFARPGGNATPSQPGKFKPMSNAEIAQRFHRPSLDVAS